MLLAFSSIVGDERPCLRCEKRGLAATCQDGVRKKAKYLNDVQPEALMPGVGGHYPRTNGSSYPSSVTVPATDYYGATPSNYGLYNGSNQSNMPPPPLSSNGSFTNQRSPTSPSFQSLASQQSPPVQSLGTTIPSSQNGSAPYQQSFSFDPSDPALFNFDISGLNFGNQYGAMEFGMLGQMAGGAADSPSNENNNMVGNMQMANYQGSISSASGFTDGANQSLMFNQDPVINSEWHARQNSGSSFALVPVEHNARNESISHPAYAIGAGPGSLASASPASTSQEYAPTFDGAPSSPAVYVSDTQRNYYNMKRSKDQKSSHFPVGQPQPVLNDRKYANIPLATLQNNADFSRKRPRDHSSIYSSVKTPYGYTEGFHSLLAYLDKWYSPDKRLRIAKAISSFRPTLISTYGQMSQDDLIHSEKGFQRLLCEYNEDFFEKYSTTAVILRRTGEVASVSKEFTMITGWTRDVLLGKAPNLNVNKGSHGNTTGNSSRGAVNTPRLATLETETIKAANGKPRSILIAELMDHDSVVTFWEDCAKAAYLDTSNEVQRRCNLMKYRAKVGDGAEYDGTDAGADEAHDIAAKHDHRSEAMIKSEADMQRLGIASGTVDCMYTWKMKRDTFDAPMMFVLQVSEISSCTLSSRC